MIKKYKEYIKENFNIISCEDVDDQFLRLKEVLDCGINLNFNKYKMYFSIMISYRKELKKEVDEEIYQISDRIKGLYPGTKTFICPMLDGYIVFILDEKYVGGLIDTGYGDLKEL